LSVIDQASLWIHSGRSSVLTGCVLFYEYTWDEGSTQLQWNFMMRLV